jgi:hypothetical protein
LIIRLGDQLESTHHLLLEVDPLRDGEVQLCLWKIDQHARDLWSLGVSDKPLDVLVDDVPNHLLFPLFFGVFEIRRDEHLLDLVEVTLSVVEVHELRSSS